MIGGSTDWAMLVGVVGRNQHATKHGGNKVLSKLWCAQWHQGIAPVWQVRAKVLSMERQLGEDLTSVPREADARGKHAVARQEMLREQAWRQDQSDGVKRHSLARKAAGARACAGAHACLTHGTSGWAVSWHV
ncbi:hypothetical protein HAX54_027786 [Datura stramonium]|uniref:Uncharacterized protein n=1 Tax=Datura stramonium TaxID=4076 RepID=A0ABS8V5N5_DATST|nr:hypothetical protein [Datura stramonium]